MAIQGNGGDYLSALHEAITTTNTRTVAQRKVISDFQRQAGLTVDINRELGLEAKKVKRTRQLQAFEEPSKYKADRDKRYEAMEAEIERIYFMIYDQLLNSGSTDDEAKDEAKKVAKSMMEAQEKAINVEFNMDTKVVDAAKATATQAEKKAIAMGYTK
jgi:regulator of replication initiation timing